MKRRSREIPEDVLFLILLRLPVKSLCRFRSVSASWLSVISDPYFIRSHVAHSETTTTTTLLLRVKNPAGSSWPDLFTCDAYRSEPVAPAGKLVPDCATGYSPSCSVRGLICYPTEAYDICVLNPSTREHISIPRPQPTKTSSEFSYFCFGFDPVAKKHKVIYSFYEGCDIGGHKTGKVMELWVFTLGSVEKWRTNGVLGDNSYHCKRSLMGEVCIDGLIYFVVFRKSADHPDRWGYCLVELDLRSECFRMVKLSTEVGMFPSHYFAYHCRLIEYEGSLALVYRISQNQFRSSLPISYCIRIDVWVLADFHKQAWDLKISTSSPDSWSYERTLDLGCALQRGKLLVFTEPDEVRVCPSFNLLFCNVESNKFWRKETPLGIYTRVCSDHIESLLSLKGSSCILDRHKRYRSSDDVISTSTR